GLHRRQPFHGAGAGSAGEVRCLHQAETAGRGRVLRFARAHSRLDTEALIDQIFTALEEETVIVATTAAVELAIPRVADQVEELKWQRATVARQVERMLEN